MASKKELIVALAIPLIISCFVSFDLYTIKSSSMYPCIYDGDIILAKKVKTSQSKLFKHKESVYKKNMILIYQSPYSSDTGYKIKRCFAHPGDTVTIKNQNLIINGMLWNQNKLPLQCEINATIHDLNTINTLFEGQEYHVTRKSIYSYDIESTPINILSIIDSCEIEDYRFLNYPNLFNNYKYYHDTGLIVPMIGDSLHLYKGIDMGIAFQALEKGNDLVSDNYYFMVGDNSSISWDSRTYGLIPQQSIKAIPVVVLFSVNRKSKNLNKIKIKRCLKRIT